MGRKELWRLVGRLCLLFVGFQRELLFMDISGIKITFYRCFIADFLLAFFVTKGDTLEREGDSGTTLSSVDI